MNQPSPRVLSPRAVRKRILTFAFTESVATILLERALYFYTRDRLGFSDLENLWLALAFGATYTVGAALSHWVANRTSEKQILVGTMAAFLILHLALAVYPKSAAIVAAFAVIGGFQGLRWPVAESYASAGLAPREQASVIGLYNIAWASAVPVALVASGPLIGLGKPFLFFGAAAVINVVGILLVLALPSRPLHDAPAADGQKAPELPTSYTRLLLSARWSMFSSYALLFLMAPLMPRVFEDLGESVERATGWAAALDVVRVVAFAALGRFTAWHGKALPLAVAIVGIPVSFVLSLFGPTLAVVVLGEVLFGAFSALVYYAALYYAMATTNASVDAGGVHEALIGLGFALGPILGIIAHAIQGVAHGYVPAMAIALGPLVLLAAIRAALALRVRAVSLQNT
jgi:MFS family permease